MLDHQHIRVKKAEAHVAGLCGGGKSLPIRVHPLIGAISPLIAPSPSARCLAKEAANTGWLNSVRQGGEAQSAPAIATQNRYAERPVAHAFARLPQSRVPLRRKSLERLALPHALAPKFPALVDQVQRIQCPVPLPE